MIIPIYSPLLSTVPRLKHVFFTRHGGISQGAFASLNFSYKTGEVKAHILENRRRAAAWFNVSAERLLIPQLVHGNQVIAVPPLFNTACVPSADGLVSDQPQYVLGVTTADCVPVLLVETKKRYVGAIHAGWRGALADIIEQGLQQFEKKGGTRKFTYVALGPSIQKYAYVVSKEVLQKFTAYEHGAADFFHSNNQGFYHFDLPGFLVFQLRNKQVADVDWVKIDTYNNAELFFSYRRSLHQKTPGFGSMLSAIMLEK